MLFSAFERLVALRYLRARRQEGFISVIAWFSLLGIALGVATLIIVMSVMNGFRAELVDRILGLSGDVTISAPASQGIADFDKQVAEIARIPGVTAAAPMIQGQVMTSANGVAGGALVRAMRREDLARHSQLAHGIVQGSLEGFDGDGVLIGSQLAARLGLAVGSPITLISPKGNQTPFGTVPRAVPYKVAGIFDVGMVEYDSGYVFMPFEAAQAFFSLPDQANAIEVILPDHDRAPDAAERIRSLVPQAERVQDWQQANAGIVGAVATERLVMFLILSLIILVAAFNIISSMIMLVKDKGRDIAILRTMGATRGMVQRIFFMAGASVGVIGTAGGLALGMAFAENIDTIRTWIQSLSGTQLFSPELAFFARLPARIDYVEVAQVVVLALALSVLATIYPSWRAARLDPVEALRYE